MLKEDKEPKPSPFTNYYIKAFYALSGSRSNGMGIGAIPLSEILVYCEFYEEDDPDMFVEIIQNADSVYLGLKSDEMKPEVKKT